MGVGVGLVVFAFGIDPIGVFRRLQHERFTMHLRRRWRRRVHRPQLNGLFKAREEGLIGIAPQGQRDKTMRATIRMALWKPVFASITLRIGRLKSSHSGCEPETHMKIPQAETVP